MTSRQRAAAISSSYSIMAAPNGHHILKAIEQAINAAVEAEREACAKIVESWARNHPSAQFTVFKAAQDIRARSNASSDPQAD